jgi:filamentous hemagglutinin
MTGLPLDEKGRYQVQVSVDNKNFAPKYFPCANTDCIRGGVNLDKSDPGTQAYIKALDGKIFKDMSTGVNYATLVTPVGAPGAILAGVGIAASIGSAATDSTAIDELLKNGSQLSATKFFTEVLGHTPAAAARAVALIDLSGGWDAFVQRLKTDFGDDKK